MQVPNASFLNRVTTQKGNLAAEGTFWGETKTKEEYTCNSYRYCKGSSQKELTKYRYIDNSPNASGLDRDSLDLSDDAVHVNKGSSWRIPTRKEWEELMDNCTFTNTELNGVSGFMVTSKSNGNTLLLPKAGYHDGLMHLGEGMYWTSTLYGIAQHAYCVMFAWTIVFIESKNRCYGLPIRPVRNP